MTMGTRLVCVLGKLLTLLALAADQSMAEPDFTNSFDDIKNGASVSLTWDGIAPQHYPLYITAQVIEKGADAHKANAYRVNLTSMCTHPLFTVVLDGEAGTRRREKFRLVVHHPSSNVGC